MVKANNNSRRCCRLCSTSFKTHSQLAKHCLDADHEANQCCEYCVRWFCSTEALSQHNEAKHRTLPAVIPSQNEVLNVPTPQPSPAFHFQDQNYKGFSLLDSSVIYDRLIRKCHPSERLKKEGYVLREETPENAQQASITKQTIMATRPTSLEPKRKAVTLDCEMAGVKNGESEIISICVIDFFTGEILINSLVKPHEPIIDWRTNIHGIRPATLAIAASQGQVLRGWEAARQELLKHINTETAMASNTHDAMEDAMAAREVALWCICYPDKLKKWAKRAHKKHKAEKAKRAERKRNKQRNMYRSAPIRDEECEDFGYYHDYGDEEDDEILRWEDVIDWEMWPKSPPSSD
ncbi:RNA exonuclease 3 [Fusarium mexicanum]|uniref:RNA exonuclease 3 n=1 Tax=Fusarium mexicanum TaxID=751941 RepID=A0A8H5JDG9_9HYPO|nr:RNA exonuclease 3 [Fusarium mexicanum]